MTLVHSYVLPSYEGFTLLTSTPDDLHFRLVMCIGDSFGS